MSSVDRVNEIVAQHENDKKSMWAEIKKRDPALAQLIEDVRQNFGKPSKLTVKFIGTDQ